MGWLICVSFLQTYGETSGLGKGKVKVHLTNELNSGENKIKYRKLRVIELTSRFDCYKLI